ncbi:hypothetical protein HDU90_001119 [Geranomyces variabilis]|nr:hypothetical protein HDU90_001119 [Geranomyces variabilis]
MSTTSGSRPSTPAPYFPQVPGFWALSCDEQTARRFLLEAAKVLSSKLDQCNKSGDFQPVHAAALSILARDAICLNQNVQPIKDLLQHKGSELGVGENSGGGTYLKKKNADKQHIIDNFMDNVKTSIAQIRLHRERVIAQLNEHSLTLTPETEA